MSDRDALLAAILAHPDEDTPRLAYADYLDEHGDAPRAEFIRVQIELARQRAAEQDLPDGYGGSVSGEHDGQRISYGHHDTPERRTLLAAEARLLGAHGEAWQDEIPKCAKLKRAKEWFRFRRGFVGQVMAALAPLLKKPAALWQHHPVESLVLTGTEHDARRKIPAWKALGALRELHLGAASYTNDLLSLVAGCPYLAGLRRLNLGNSYPPDADAAALSRSPHLRPEYLWIGCGQLTENVFAGLMNSPFVSRLRQFMPHGLGPWGSRVIAEAPLSGLRSLRLGGGRCDVAGVEALARSKHLTRLVTLQMSAGSLTDDALETLAAWSGLVSVRSLSLSFNKAVTGRGVAALVRSPHLQPIHISLRYTDTGDDGAKELAAWSGLANLVVLDLGDTQLGEAGAQALARSPYWKDIRHLNLKSHEKIGERAVALIRERFAGQPVDIET